MRHLDWNGIQEVLQFLAANKPHMLRGAVLIGGAACWFYRIQLERRADSNFPAPVLTEEQQSRWLSKDVDFANLEDSEGVEFVGRLQFGVRVGSEDYLENALPVQIGGVGVLIADALDLLKEKQACCAKLGRPQDFLHRETLEQFVSLDLVDKARAVSHDPLRAPVFWKRLSLIKLYAPELLIREPLAGLLAKASPGL